MVFALVVLASASAVAFGLVLVLVLVLVLAFVGQSALYYFPEMEHGLLSASLKPQPRWQDHLAPSSESLHVQSKLRG